MSARNRNVNKRSLLLCVSLSFILVQGCMNGDGTNQTVRLPEGIANEVIPYPTEWVGYRERPDMRGKKLGIISHLFVIDGTQSEARSALARVVDIAIQEPTCLVLKAAQSISDPSHFILYEEWSDYDEFFSVQLSRAYRSDFTEWLGPLNAKPAGPEFFEIYHDAGTNKSITGGAFAAVSSTLITNSDAEELVRNRFVSLIDEVAQQTANNSFVAHHSINDPNHFVLYEEWSDSEEFRNGAQQMNDRGTLSAGLEEIGDIESRIEFFEIFYDPGKD